MKGSGGELLVKNILEVVLAVAFVFLILVFFYQLISPGYDIVNEFSNSYFDLLKEQAGVAKSGAMGIIPAYPANKDFESYLVYFKEGDHQVDVPGKDDMAFVRRNSNEAVCVCSVEDEEVLCKSKYCLGLDSPVEFIGGEVFLLSYGVEITYEGDPGYIFRSSAKEFYLDGK